MERQLTEVASVIARAKNLVAFTGSGVSAESGIPTFRDPVACGTAMTPINWEPVATSYPCYHSYPGQGDSFFKRCWPRLSRPRPIRATSPWSNWKG